MDKIAIVNFAKGAWYQRGAERLRKSVQKYTGCDFYSFDDEAVIGAEQHSQNPYNFKIYAIEKAIKMGYERVLWMDSSLYFIAEPKDLFLNWEKTGVIMQYAEIPLGRYINNNCLKNLKISREFAYTIDMYSAGLTGLDLSRKDCKEFLAEWKYHMSIGSFKGNWKDHRHDMSVASYLAFKYKFELSNCNKYMAYLGDVYPKAGKDVVIICQGM